MARPLLNYTTEVPVERTVAEIQRILVGRGAIGIAIDYSAGLPVALGFTLPTKYGPASFRLPARVDRVLAVLARQRRAGLLAPRHATAEQAARVGWRIAKDWLEAQLAIVEAEMVDLDEVLMPYMVDRAGGQTFFETYVDRMKQLPGRSSGG